ncbi:MAG: TetR/AcrR family transcriptional regulator [Acidimicrobiia bacterium]
MARLREFETREVLTRAMGVFWQQGYEATTIEDLTRATGLSRSSLYSTFESKRGLFDAVMGRYMEGIDDMLGPLESGHDGLDDVVAFFEGWRGRIHGEADGSLGCLMINTLAERGHVDPTVAAAGGEYLTRLRSAFARALRAASERGEVAPDSIGRLAEVLMLVTTGLFVASRGQSVERIESLLDTAIAEVESHRV